MKKLLILLFIIVASFSLFASGATEDGGYKDVTNTAFKPMLSNDPGSLAYKLHTNPASLVRNKLVVQLPSVAIEGYNIADAISQRSVAEAVSRLMKFNFNTADLVRLGVGMVENVGSGNNRVLGVNIQAGAAIKRFAFGLDVVLNANTMPSFRKGTEIPIGSDNENYELQGLGKTAIVPVVDIAATLAYGTRVYDSDSMTVDAGISVRAIRRLYMEQLDASSVVNKGMEINNKATRGGFAFPVDLNVEFGVFGDNLKASISATNLNGYFYMQKYGNYKDALSMKNGNSKYTVYTPWSLNLELELSHSWKLFEPRLSVRFDDIVGFFKYKFAINKLMYPRKEILRHLSFRADIALVKFIRINAAYKQGYLEFGGALDFYGNTIELSYGYHEAGENYGEKPVDTLTLRIKLGFDKK